MWRVSTNSRPAKTRSSLGSVSSYSPGNSRGPCKANNPRPHKVPHGLQPYRPHSARLRATVGRSNQPPAAPARRRPECRDRKRSASSQPAVLIQQGDHISDSPGVGFVGVELVAELNTIASSLLLSSASRAFSFLICSVSLLTREDSVLSSSDSFLSCSISFSSCFVRSLEALICFSMSGLRRQLSVCKNKRHRGKDEPHAPLLLELEVDACWEGDVVIGAEQGDQGNHKARMGLDDPLAIKPGAAPGRIWIFRQVWRRFGRGTDLHQNRTASRLRS